MPDAILIGGHAVGPGNPAFLIAEVAQSHDGSLGLAHAFIDSAAKAGADAVKFQTHIAAAESTLDEPFRTAFSTQDDTRYNYWKRMEFTAEQWAGLAAHAAHKGLVFLSSAFSIEAMEILKSLGMLAWKIGSGELASHQMLSAIAQSAAASGAPVLLSTGMTSFAEIDTAAELVLGQGAGLGVFQCTSRYPAALEEVGLNVMDQLRSRLVCPVGLSDHTGTVHPALAAIARGADMIEVHIALDKSMFGPDVPVSLTPDEIALLRAARDAVAVMDANPVDNDAMAEAMAPMRSLFNKSVATVRDLPSGTILVLDMLTEKKPGTGIPAADLPTFIGRVLARDVSSARLLVPEDLESSFEPEMG